MRTNTTTAKCTQAVLEAIALAQTVGADRALSHLIDTGDLPAWAHTGSENWEDALEFAREEAGR